MPRKTKELYEAAYKRGIRDTKEERDIAYGRVSDHLHNKSVELFWDLSPEAKQNQLFRLKVGREEVVLDAEQFMKYLRWV